MLLEALGLVAIFALIPQLAMSRAGGLLAPHPGWIAVLVLAGRYGSGGFFTGLLTATCAVGIGSLASGAGLQPLARSDDVGSDLIALGVCLFVSWMASWHLRLESRLSERLREVSDRATAHVATIKTLHEAVSRLRARVDRAATSLSFLRDVAARLEGDDPVAAAEGAADLALARTGATAAAVKAGAGAFQRLLAVRDARGPKGLAPLAMDGADLIVPIRSGVDRVGVIALWGVPRSGLDEATVHDLSIIASWCTRALGFAAPNTIKEPGHAGCVS